MDEKQTTQDKSFYDSAKNQMESLIKSTTDMFTDAKKEQENVSDSSRYITARKE